MAFQDLLITEIFHSLQGETSLVGVPFVFIRLTGCNLRCTYCDSAYAFHGGTKMTIEDVLARVASFGAKHVLVTGGEPLLQRQTPELVKRLRSTGYDVSIETHGEISIETVVADARIVMDIKTPSSGMSREGFVQNLPLLKPGRDEIKFVIASMADYEFAKSWIQSGKLPACETLLSPAVIAQAQPGEFPGVSAPWLAEKILADRLPVRFQVQLHKILWGADRKGV